jgi:hypothetical protein
MNTNEKILATAIIILITFNVITAGILYNLETEAAKNLRITDDLSHDYSACLWATTCLTSPADCLLEGIGEEETETIVAYCLMQPNMEQYIEEGIMEAWEE